MSSLIKIAYGDNKEIMVEVESNTVSDVEQLRRKTTKEIQSTGQNLEKISTTIVEASQIMMGSFYSIATIPMKADANKLIIPSKATLEFGVRFTGEGDIYIVKASAEAALKVIVEWVFKE